MGKVIYISCATKNTPYIEIIEKGLIPSLQKFKLPYDIEYIDSRGNWTLNTQLKAMVIHNLMLEHQQPVVMLDADAVVVRYPSVFDHLQEYDLAFHNLDTDLFWRGKRGTKREPLTGTLYVNFNETSLRFVSSWIEENLNHPEKHDMANFGSVLLKYPEITIYNLPLEYVAIVNRNNEVPPTIHNPVIVHYQASRRLRSKIT